VRFTFQNPWMIGLVAGTAFVASSLFLEWARNPTAFSVLKVPWYLGDYVATFALAAGLALIDRVGVAERYRVPAVVLAAVAASGAFLAYSMLSSTLVPVAWEVPPLRMSLANVLISFATSTMIGLAWEFHRRAVRGDASVRALQREQADLARRDLQTRLQALQAQVDPQFLFGTLKDVDSLHDRAPGDADALLEALIAHLRAVLPGVQERTSTVGRQVDLVRSYLTVMGIRSAGRIRSEVRIDGSVSGAPLAPTLVLPLVQCVLPADGSSASISVVAGLAEGQRVRVVVEADGPVRDEKALAGVCERADAIGDGNAALVHSTSGRGTTLRLELPLASTSS
jgi:hypothetical protein